MSAKCSSGQLVPLGLGVRPDEPQLLHGEASRLREALWGLGIGRPPGPFLLCNICNTVQYRTVLFVLHLPYDTTLPCVTIPSAESLISPQVADTSSTKHSAEGTSNPREGSHRRSPPDRMLLGLRWPGISGAPTVRRSALQTSSVSSLSSLKPLCNPQNPKTPSTTLKNPKHPKNPQNP